MASFSETQSVFDTELLAAVLRELMNDIVGDPPESLAQAMRGRDHVVILTNLPLEEAGAWELCEIYKQRWTIELFFRWLKCLLPCRHWLAESEDGVATQVYCSLIVALLLSRRSGKLPTKRMMERLRFWMIGWASDEELAAALGPEKERN